MPDRDYEKRKKRESERNRRSSLSGRDIGALPKVVDPKRRRAARRNFQKFCELYFADTFSIAWSPDHLRVIKKVQQVVLKGARLAVAMPRGSGKTSICEVAVIWAVLYGHRRFAVAIGASEGAAHELLDTIVAHIETNDVLAEDFPEVCAPIRKLDGIVNRCAGQLCQGERTKITWTKSEIILPSIKGSLASSAIVKVAGITGRVRGMKYQRPDGQSVRPDLVVVDDCQTDESADSLTQCAKRERTLAGAVLGLAGPGAKIAALMPCTVIRPGDMADSILDRTKHPEWNGERTKLIYKIPKSKLWDKYAEIRADSLRKHGDIREATAFYKKNQTEMDRGAKVAWPERFEPDEISAVQSAMNLKLQDEESFWAEYQNEPLKDAGLEDAGLLTKDQVAAKMNGYEHRAIPIGASRLTAFVDVQKKVLYWLVVAWGEEFTGFVVDYGTFPDQKREYFSLTDAQHTLARLSPGAGTEGAIYAGLEGISDQLLGKEWPREDGTPMRIDLCMVDANWGETTDVIYQFCRQSVHAAVLIPSHGQYYGPNVKPMIQWAKKPGDRLGLNWQIPGGRGKRAVRHVNYDTNYWKTFVHERLSQKMGDPGCLSLFGRSATRHRMLSEHLTSETRERMKGSRRVVDVWSARPGVRDNHLLDCLVGAAVAASIRGVALPGIDPAGQPMKRKRVRFSDLQRARRR